MSTIILGWILVLFHLPLPPCGRLGLATGLTMYSQLPTSGGTNGFWGFSVSYSQRKFSKGFLSSGQNEPIWAPQLCRLRCQTVDDFAPHQESREGKNVLQLFPFSQHQASNVDAALRFSKAIFCRSGDTAASSSSSGRSLPRALDLTWGLRCGTAKACVTWNTQCLGKRHANLKGESIGFWRFLQMIPKNHGF